MSKYYVNKAINGQFYFNLTGKNGEIILTSETYVTRQGCNDGITSVRTHSPYDSNYKKHTATNGQFYFTLVSNNNKIIGTSEMYSFSSSRENGIASVKENGPKAEVVDRAPVY
ncbi:MAG: YegP family protein [Bacteroidia bacterium]|nr:YegP family protein [Bacteroidia bacterium]